MNHDKRKPEARSQRGGFALGLIVGLLVGLALALAVALYVTKVPVPFVNKVPYRSAEQDAAEAARNKDWDPNAPLAGRSAARPSPIVGADLQAAPATPPAAPVAGTAALAAPAGAPVVAPAAVALKPPPLSASAARSGRDPAAILAGAPIDAARSTAPGADAFVYFVQAGAYSRAEDAEQQRGRLAMLGLDARVSEREQTGRTVHRVRLGPFDSRAEAEAVQAQLAEVRVESNLVRVDR